MIEIRYPVSKKEVSEAIEVACKSFPVNYFEAKSLKSAMIKFLPEEFTPKNFIIAAEGKRIVGILRFFRREIIISTVKFDILGLTDYCVDKSQVKDPIFGVRFLLKCCEMLRETDYALACGSARKSMLNYYYPFGFIGCDSYCSCSIEKLKISGSVPPVKFEEVFHEQNIGRYEAFRLQSNSSEWGMICRNKNYWRWIGFQAKELEKIRFFEIKEGSQLIGYFVISGNKFVDYGIMDNNVGAYIHAMIKYLLEEIPPEDLRLQISPANKLFRYLGLSNISYSMRHVPDEGIIALGLNKKKLVEVFCRILSSIYRGFGFKDDVVTFSKAASFRWTRGELMPMFEPDNLKKKDEQVLLNSMFLGTYGPFSLLNYEGPRVLPPTYYRMNELDAV